MNVEVNVNVNKPINARKHTSIFKCYVSINIIT